MLKFLALIMLCIAATKASDCMSNHGWACMSKSELPRGNYYGYWKGADPCFTYKGWRGANFCFTSTNRWNLCDPSAPGCSGGGNGGKGGRCMSIHGCGPMICDDSNLPTDDCSSTIEKYCKISPDHVMCRYCGVNRDTCGKVCSRGITLQADKDHIVAKHNELRRKVAKGLETRGNRGGGQPPAKDMYELKWSDELAAIAQRRADQCDNLVGLHPKAICVGKSGCDTAKYQKVEDNAYGFATQNLIGKVRNYDQFIQPWYDLVKNHQTAKEWYEQYATSFDYVQMIYGEMKEVGCGFIVFKPNEFYQQFLVCLYGAEKDKFEHYQALKIPVPIYTEGETASLCPNGDNDGLCTW